MNHQTFKKTAELLTETVIKKNTSYGDSVNRAPQCLAILAPDGVQPHQYRDASLAVRLLDKIARVFAMPPGSDEENPWADAAGYCLIRANEVLIEAKRARFFRCSTPDSTEAEIAEAAEILEWLAEHYGEGSPELVELRQAGRFVDFLRNPLKPKPKPAPGCRWQKQWGDYAFTTCRLPAGHSGDHSYPLSSGGHCGHVENNRVCLLQAGHRGKHDWREVPEPPPAAPTNQPVPVEL